MSEQIPRQVLTWMRTAAVLERYAKGLRIRTGYNDIEGILAEIRTELEAAVVPIRTKPNRVVLERVSPTLAIRSVCRTKPNGTYPEPTAGDHWHFVDDTVRRRYGHQGGIRLRGSGRPR